MSELEELQKKIDNFLELNDDLYAIGMCSATHDGNRGYLQTMFDDLVDLSEKFNLDLSMGRIESAVYDWEVSVSGLKMYAIATNVEMRRRGLLPAGDTNV